MALSFNRLADRAKLLVLQFAGDPGLRDDLSRCSDSYQDFTLSAAQMDTLNATPVTLVAAPGSGLTNVVTSVMIQVNSTGFTAFSLGSGVLEIRYTDGSGAKTITDITNAVVASVTDVMDYCPAIVCAPLANAVICAHTSTDVTAGTGNIQGRIYYKTVKVSEIVA